MNREQLKTLCALEGISGREQAVRAYLQQQLRDLPAVPVIISATSLWKPEQV